MLAGRAGKYGSGPEIIDQFAQACRSPKPRLLRNLWFASHTTERAMRAP